MSQWQLLWHKVLCAIGVRRGVWWYATMECYVGNPDWKVRVPTAAEALEFLKGTDAP